MNNIDLKNATYFEVDYRSAAWSIGQVYHDSGEVTLVTDRSCGPQDLSEAKMMIEEDDWPTAVDNIPFHMGEYWDEGQLVLKAILCTHRVEYVVDVELAFEREDLVESIEQSVFTLKNWLKARDIDSVI